MPLFHSLIRTVAGIGVFLAAGIAFSQTSSPSSNQMTDQLGIPAGGSQIGTQLSPLNPSQTPSETSATQEVPKPPYTLTARYHLQRGTRQGYLVLQVDLAPGNHIYSLTQKGIVKPSSIQVVPTDSMKLLGNFLPDRNPVVIEKDPIFEQRMETHQGTVQFFVPIAIREDIDLKAFHPALLFSGQVCSDSGVCLPVNRVTVQGRFAGYFDRPTVAPSTAKKESPTDAPSR